jgi:hypothetical protein
MLCRTLPSPPLQVADTANPELVKRVVGYAVEALEGMGQMPSSRRQVEEPDVKEGMDSSRTERLLKLLTAEGRSRHVVLLHGSGGIGKTTLARAVFNQLRERGRADVPCCFVSLDPDTDEERVMQKQRQLLQELADVQVATLHTAEYGRQLLARKLRSKRVVVVVDNVWGDRLEFLLPKNFMQLVGEGSMVLVTSREQGAARKLQGVTEVEMEGLSDAQSVELFCKYAFPGLASVPSSWEQLVERSPWASQILAVLKLCAGLPMALEVVGRYFAACRDKGNFHSRFQEACRKQAAGRLEAERTLFGALGLSWSMLQPEEQEALLDIAFILKGESWDWVQLHCGPSVLGRLCGLGLVKQQASATRAGDETLQTTAVAAVDDMVTYFCGVAGAIGRPPRREVVGTSGEVQQVCVCVALCLVGEVGHVGVALLGRGVREL